MAESPLERPAAVPPGRWPASTKLPLPDFLTASASHRLGSATLMGAFQYSFWSRFDVSHLVPDDPSNGLDVSSLRGR